MKSDYRQLLREVEATGHELVHGRGGHLKVKRGGKTIATIPSSIGQGRAHQNTRALLRRLGVIA